MYGCSMYIYASDTDKMYTQGQQQLDIATSVSWVITVTAWLTVHSILTPLNVRCLLSMLRIVITFLRDIILWFWGWGCGISDTCKWLI